MKFLTLVILIFGVANAKASDRCKESLVRLACQVSYNLVSSYATEEGDSKVEGPRGVARVLDIQPEPFDPPNCSASVVLFTYAGRFVATFSQEHETLNAWIDSNGHFQVLIQDQEISQAKPLSAQIPSPFAGIVSSVDFTCHLQN